MKTFAVVTLCLLVVARANANCNLNLDRKTRQLFSSSGLNFPGPRTKVPIRNTPPSTIPPSSIPTPPLPKQVPISARIDNHSKKASKATNRPLHVPAYVHNGKAVPFKSSPQPFENQRQKHQSFHSFTQVIFIYSEIILHYYQFLFNLGETEYRKCFCQANRRSG